MAPIQFLSHDYGFVNLATLDVDGGTVLFYEKNGRRYLVTAWHIWEEFTKVLSQKSTGWMHAAFVCGSRLMPLQKDLRPSYLDVALDVVIFSPEWLSHGLPEFDFFTGNVAGVSEGDPIRSWGYPKTARTVSGQTVQASWRELRGNATAPCNESFKFVPSPPTSEAFGGFSGAPVFRDDSSLVGMISQGGSGFGIVKCSELLSAVSNL